MKTDEAIRTARADADTKALDERLARIESAIWHALKGLRRMAARETQGAREHALKGRDVIEGKAEPERPWLESEEGEG